MLKPCYRATIPLAALCLTVGLSDAVTYSRAQLWIAFQTGNSVQLAMSIPNLLKGEGRIEDGQRALVFLFFGIGAFLNGRIGDKHKIAKSRFCLFLATLAQAVLQLLAALMLFLSRASLFLFSLSIR